MILQQFERLNIWSSGDQRPPAFWPLHSRVSSTSMEESCEGPFEEREITVDGAWQFTLNGRERCSLPLVRFGQMPAIQDHTSMRQVSQQEERHDEIITSP
jgi:hypothetical protein